MYAQIIDVAAAENKPGKPDILKLYQWSLLLLSELLSLPSIEEDKKEGEKKEEEDEEDADK